MKDKDRNFSHNCPICIKNTSYNEYKVYENELIIISHSPIEKNIKGYFYIEFKRHIEFWSDLTQEEVSESGRAIKILDKFLKNYLNAARTYTVVISEEIRHLHIHVIPRYISDELRGIKLIERATQGLSHRPNKVTNKEIQGIILKFNKYAKCCNLNIH